ncbi:MlaD family protein [Pseudomonas sp. F1_0610]|uniref:MlaD family protein n=1 Tax=Pseudomonas sp. F1_0610 TaxID=3114284 RepID=UPI0039C2DC9A
MSETRKPLLIGGFLLAGLTLLVIALLVLNRVSLFSKPEQYVIYFRGALDGLDVGADVTYRGVKVGSVTAIRLSYDAQINDMVMPVIIQIDYASSGHTETESKDKDRLNKFLERAVQRGLRAQLQTPSLLTGKAIVALDFFPEEQGYINLEAANDLELVAIPSVPSAIDKAADVVRDLVEGLKSMPLQEILVTANKTLESIDRITNSPELSGSLERLNNTLANLEAITASLRSEMPALMKNAADSTQELNKAMRDVSLAVKSAQQALEQMNGLVVDSRRSIGPQSELQFELLQSLKELTHASKSLQRTADGLNNDPQSLIFGKQR